MEILVEHHKVSLICTKYILDVMINLLLIGILSRINPDRLGNLNESVDIKFGPSSIS